MEIRSAEILSAQLGILQTAQPRGKVMRSSIFVSLCLFVSLVAVPGARADAITDVKQLQSQYISALEGGDAKKALELSDKAVALMGNVGVLWSDRGAICLRMGNLDEALKAFDKAVELDPSPSVLANRAQLYTHLKRYDDAIADCDKAIKLDPNNYFAYNNRAIAEMGKPDLQDKCIADLDKTLELKPDMAMAHQSRGKMRLEKGDLEGAKADLDKSIELSPKEASAYSTRAAMFWRMKDKDKAIADITHACELSKDPIFAQSKEFMQTHEVGTPAVSKALSLERVIDARKPEVAP